MQVSKTQAEITHVNVRKENAEDGEVLATDVSVTFTVPRATVDRLFPVDGFTNQFYSGEDTRLECLYPIVYRPKVEDLRVTLHIGLKPMVFDGAKIARNLKITPQLGGYAKCECKLQLHPNRDQCGRLAEAVHEHADVEIEKMTADLMDAA